MCIINHAYRFVFVHIPKTGGTSVAQYLSRLSTYRDLEIGATPLGEALAPQYFDRFGLAKHSTLLEIAKVLGDATISSYTTFAVVRDPLHRVRSSFSFLKEWNGWRSLDRQRPYVEEFDRCRSVNEFIGSAFFKTPGPDRLFRPQVSWISGADGASVIVDRIVRLESLETDLRGLLRDIGASEPDVTSAIPRANPSRLDGGILDEASVRLVQERYALDFALLGYATTAPKK